MSIDSDILFAGLDLPSIDREGALSELASIPADQWVWDEYRGTYMLPLMTRNGLENKDSLYNLHDLSQKNYDYQWTKHSPRVIVDYFEKHVLNWINPRPRIVVLRTPPNASINPHIDCQVNEYGTRQLKFRLVLSGAVDSLYFITESGPISAPKEPNTFIMDGSWPHAMTNLGKEDKITICIGAPWTGADEYPRFVNVLKKSNYRRPSDIMTYFKK